MKMKFILCSSALLLWTMNIESMLNEGAESIAAHERHVSFVPAVQLNEENAKEDSTDKSTKTNEEEYQEHQKEEVKEANIISNVPSNEQTGIFAKAYNFSTGVFKGVVEISKSAWEWAKNVYRIWINRFMQRNADSTEENKENNDEQLNNETVNTEQEEKSDKGSSESEEIEQINNHQDD